MTDNNKKGVNERQASKTKQKHKRVKKKKRDVQLLTGRYESGLPNEIDLDRRSTERILIGSRERGIGFIPQNPASDETTDDDGARQRLLLGKGSKSYSSAHTAENVANLTILG